MELLPHQERMIIERDELGKKVVALREFFLTEQFNALGADDGSLLRMQYAAMMHYQIILHMRICKFAP